MVSEATARVIDEQVRELVDTAHADVTALIGGHRDQLESLARELLARETLDMADAYAAAGLPSDGSTEKSGAELVAERHGEARARPEPLYPRSTSTPARRDGGSEPGGHSS